MPPGTVRVKKILDALAALYPEAATQLTHENAFQLLTATIMSAQCTDRQVNQVTPRLFARYPTPEDLAGADISELEAIIRSTGFFHNKAKNIRAAAGALVDRHGGEVPPDMDSLTRLPGVGRKTANVVRSAFFGLPSVVVDTHVARISRRLGLTDEKDPEKIEQDVMAVLPKASWSDFSIQLIYHGRKVCRARTPLCGECLLADGCDYGREWRKGKAEPGA
ncbi:MAG: endonuclease III [Proteobacteria bacterium]|nr:endonuclease III [Pseudomonadota bacterium]